MAVKLPFNENRAFLMCALVQGTTPNKGATFNLPCCCFLFLIQSVQVGVSPGTGALVAMSAPWRPSVLYLCLSVTAHSLWFPRLSRGNPTACGAAGREAWILHSSFFCETKLLNRGLFHHLIDFLNPSQLTHRTLRAGAVPLCELPAVLGSIPPSLHPECCWTYTGFSNLHNGVHRFSGKICNVAMVGEGCSSGKQSTKTKKNIEEELLQDWCWPFVQFCLLLKTSTSCRAAGCQVQSFLAEQCGMLLPFLTLLISPSSLSYLQNLFLTQYAVC